MKNNRSKLRSSETYQNLEKREVLASFLPVDVVITPGGEAVLTANPESEQTVIDIDENDQGEIVFREVIGISDPSVDGSVEPGFIYGDFVTLSEATSVRYIGNEFPGT